MKRLIVFLLLSCLAGCGEDPSPRPAVSPFPPTVPPRPPLVAPFGRFQVKALQRAWADHLGTPVQITNSIGVKLNLITPGEFTMGSPESERGRLPDETQHRVKITQPFYLSVHEVTQEQYEKLIGKNPSFFSALGKGKDLVSGIDTSQFPVESVNWYDVVAFCSKLSDQEGDQYRLPTEAEWEYACRAGTSTAYSFGDDVSVLGEYAWSHDNSTHPVGELKPNAWALYDMHGNVWEWCSDWHGPYGNKKVVSDPTGPASGEDRVLRGGPYYLLEIIRAAFRLNNIPAYRRHSYGFRLARTIPSSP